MGTALSTSFSCQIQPHVPFLCKPSDGHCWCANFYSVVVSLSLVCPCTLPLSPSNLICLTKNCFFVSAPTSRHGKANCIRFLVKQYN